jgi:hypothetical protein
MAVQRLYGYRAVCDRCGKQSEYIGRKVLTDDNIRELSPSWRFEEDKHFGRYKAICPACLIKDRGQNSEEKNNGHP